MLIACRNLNHLTGIARSFLGDRLRKYPGYKFLPHYCYFLNNLHRWNNAKQVQDRILAAVPSDSDAAWEAWRQFRSAQGEISSVFLIENYLRGEVDDLEVSPPQKSKSCDISARFDSGAVCYFEVKSQSGQQHGDGHPLIDGAIGFTPQDENDLRSWLFEKRVSSTNGQPMVPMCKQASEKGADVLIAFMDIFHWDSHDNPSFGKSLVPDAQGMSKVVYRRTFWRHLSCQNVLMGILQRVGVIRDSLCIHVLEAGENTSQQMGTLREIWLLSSSALAEMLIIRSRGATKVLDGTDA